MALSRYAWLVAFGALAVLGAPYAASPGEAPTAGTVVTPPKSGAGPSPAGAAGMVIHRDPVTGQVGVPPPASLTGLPATPGFGNAVEVPGTTPGGGVKLVRPGGFMSTMSGTRDAADKISVHCEPGHAGREE